MGQIQFFHRLLQLVVAREVPVMPLRIQHLAVVPVVAVELQREPQVRQTKVLLVATEALAATHLVVVGVGPVLLAQTLLQQLVAMVVVAYQVQLLVRLSIALVAVVVAILVVETRLEAEQVVAVTVV